MQPMIPGSVSRITGTPAGRSGRFSKSLAPWPR